MLSCISDVSRRWHCCFARCSPCAALISQVFNESGQILSNVFRFNNIAAGIARQLTLQIIVICYPYASHLTNVSLPPSLVPISIATNEISVSFSRWSAVSNNVQLQFLLQPPAAHVPHYTLQLKTIAVDSILAAHLPKCNTRKPHSASRACQIDRLRSLC